jgi:V8-like Glu-specific endopeptidase
MKKESKGHKLEKNGQSEEEKEYFERCKQFSEIASLIAESDSIVSEEEVRCEPEKPSLEQNEEHEYIEEALVTPSDDRKMVRNSAVHPYNGLGKLLVRVVDRKTDTKGQQYGTAFLIAKNLIMTAAHNLFHIE